MRKRRIEKWERDIENRRKIQKEEEILKISYLLFQNSYLLSQIEIPEQLSIPSAIYMDQPLGYFSTKLGGLLAATTSK